MPASEKAAATRASTAVRKARSYWLLGNLTTPHRSCRDWSGGGHLYCAVAMPKMKSHSGAKKRFKKTATGKLRARHANSSHILEKKSPKRKRHLGNPTILKPPDAKRVKKLLGAKSK